MQLDPDLTVGNDMSFSLQVPRHYSTQSFSHESCLFWNTRIGPRGPSNSWIDTFHTTLITTAATPTNGSQPVVCTD